MRKIDFRPQVKGVKTGVKKTLAGAAAGATFLALAVPVLANSFTIELVSLSQANLPKIIDLSLDSINKKTGDFSGEAIGAKREIWEVTGTVLGNKVEIEFTGLSDGQRIVATGEIGQDGIIAGKAAAESGELFEWETADGAVLKSST